MNDPAPRSYRDAMLALGIDIGGSGTKCSLLRPGGHDRPESVCTCAGDGYADPTPEDITRCIRACLAGPALAEAWSKSSAVDAAAFVRVGLCLPGVFDQASRSLVRAINVPRMVGKNIDELVREALGFAPPQPVCVCTDAYAAGYDYVRTHSSQLAGRTLALSLGTGVGACVLDGLTPLIVSGGGPGHIGQLDVALGQSDEPIPVGRDGARGTLEAYIGVPALRARYGERYERLPQRGEEALREPPIRALVRALRISHAIYRPDAIVLMGGVGCRLSPIVGAIRAAVAEGLTTLAKPDWKLLAAEHGYHAACGAARLALANA